MGGDALAFWGFVTLVGLSIVWTSHLNRRDVERTIRHAIERGLPLDAQAIRQFKSGSPAQTAPYFIVAGVMLMSIALGLAVFAIIIAPEEPDTLLPLIGIAAFIAFPGLATTLSGFWLRRHARVPAAEE